MATHAYLTTEGALDVALILKSLNDLDEGLEAQSSSYRVQLPSPIMVVDDVGDPVGQVENEIGPGAWAFTAYED